MEEKRFDWMGVYMYFYTIHTLGEGGGSLITHNLSGDGDKGGLVGGVTTKL